MSSWNVIGVGAACRRPLIIALLFSISAALPKFRQAEAAGAVQLWDTISPGSSAAGAAESERSSWKAVPENLLMLEADPFKASSDPAYYGREYVFQGEPVVETPGLTAVFSRSQGLLTIYSRRVGGHAQGGSAAGAGGRKLLEIAPLAAKAGSSAISQIRILQNTGDDVGLQVSFSGEGSGESALLFSFNKTDILEVNGGEGIKGIRVSSVFDYGVVPDFIGDDLIYRPADYEESKAVHVPAEDMFLGLMKGEGAVLVMTWPKGKQQMTLGLGAGDSERRGIETIDFEGAGQPVYISVLQAAGIWHREPLGAPYLERDVTSQWKRPFSAKWQTQLTEAGVRATYSFREAKGTIWRGVPGMYNYPVWFEGDNALFHLSKKVPPKEEALIYFVEGKDTPVSVATPVDILKATLGRPAAEGIIDVAGRQLRTHHRRGSDGVRRACTCGCTEAIQAIFEGGQEVEMKDYVSGAVDDMIYFVQRHMARIEEYQEFAREMLNLIHSRESASPELKPYLEQVEAIAQRISEEYTVQKENMKSLEHAHELGRKTVALTAKKDSQNLAGYLELGKEWRAMGGAQDYILAECNTLTRKLFQEAGYASSGDAKSVLIAQEIRARCRQVLRNPDGYEIWPNH